MGVRNRAKETLDRLAAKTLDARFLHEIEHGLNCSPFEGQAVLQVVKEVCFPSLGGGRSRPIIRPSRGRCWAVSANAFQATSPMASSASSDECGRICGV